MRANYLYYLLSPPVQAVQAIHRVFLEHARECRTQVEELVVVDLEIIPLAFREGQ